MPDIQPLMNSRNLIAEIAIMAGFISVFSLEWGSTGSSFTTTTTLPTAWADDKEANEYADVEELARDVDDGELDDDHIDYSDFKASVAYQRADEEIRECIDEAEELGENLADYEVLECTDEYEE